MLKAIIIGHVGQDATIKTFGNNNYIAFSVAHSEKYKDKNGVDHESTQWVSCLKRIGDNSQLVAYIKKGTKVYVEGALSAKVFDKAGVPEVGLNCNVSHLELLSPKQESTVTQPADFKPQQSSNATAPNTFSTPVVVPMSPNDLSDDLPF